MRKVILYTAVSLDQFIAGPDGELDWLLQDDDYGFKDFYATIDTLLMGRNTYTYIEQYKPYPHEDKMNFVFSHNLSKFPEEYLRFISGDPADFTRKLKEKPGQDIWLVGGGQVNATLMEAGLIDEMILSIHPIQLGRGIHLFAGPISIQNFETLDVKPYPSGLVQWHLRRK